MARFYGGESYYLLWNKKINKFWAAYAATLVIWSNVMMWVLVIKYHFNFFPTVPIELGFFLAIYILTKTADNRLKIAVFFKKGITGERRIARVLVHLSDDYKVYCDLKVPGHFNNIDFAVVGPTGIFSIEVKNIAGKIDVQDKKVIVNGQNLPYKDIIKQTCDEYWGLHDYLKDKFRRENFVIPVLVFANNRADFNFGFGPVVDGIHILHDRDLLEFIKTSAPYSYYDSREKIEDYIKPLAQDT